MREAANVTPANDRFTSLPIPTHAPMTKTPRAISLCLFICAFAILPARAQPDKIGGTDTQSIKVPQIPLPAPSASARDLFSRYKDRLVQVRVLLNSANEQSSLGSGFVVKDDGPKGVWLLTN